MTGRFGMSRQLALCLSTSCLIVALAACGGDSGSGAGDAQSAASPTVPPLSGPPVLGEPVWARSIEQDTNEPVEQVDFLMVTDPVLYLTVPVERLPSGTDLVASWTYNDTVLEGTSSQLVADRDQTGGWLEVHLQRTNDDPWPDGTYQVELTFQGTPIVESSIEVVEDDG